MRFFELNGDPWVLRIWTAINQAVQAGRMKKIKHIFELGIAISTKLNMLPEIAHRINKSYRELCREIRKNRDQKYEFTSDRGGYGFEIDKDFKYRLLIDIDSLLFELNSCCELMKRFIYKIYNHTGTKMKEGDIGKKIKDIIRNRDGDTAWFEKLDKLRNSFIHEEAPDIAMDISDESKYDLLIMNKDIKDFNSGNNDDAFIKLSMLGQIVKDFLRSKTFLQEHLIQYIRNL